MKEIPVPSTIVQKKPFLGRAVNGDRKLRFLSAKQILTADAEHDGCLRKYANQYVFGLKVARTVVLDEGVSLAKQLEIYLTTGTMMLEPVLRPTIKFFPEPKNPETGLFDLLCEEPLGNIEKALELRDKILAFPDALNVVEATAEVRKLAGLTARGIPFEGAADVVHRRGIYKNKAGVLVPEPHGVVAVEILDLKSTSRINTKVTPSATLQGWAQTDAEVVRDPQMVAYGKHRLDMWSDATHVRLNKVYAQKKPYDADIRGGLVSRQQVEDAWGELEKRVVDEIIATATAEKIDDVRPSRGSCDAFTHLEPCGYLGCGVGCFPGKIMVNHVEQICPGCKGKARTARGCPWRGTKECPESTNSQVPMSFDIDPREPSKGAGMGISLFDVVDGVIAPTPPTPPTPPRPPMDQATYDSQVAAEQAAIEAELLGAPVTVSSPPSAKFGEKISVALCVSGDEYMVDCEDGKPPYRMKFREASAGSFKFVDALGAKADLKVSDHVWRLLNGASVSAPVPPPEKKSCGAPGCGVDCQPGWVKSLESSTGYLLCKGCNGKGEVSVETMAVKPPDAPKVPWIDQQAPLPDEEIERMRADPNTDPKLLDVVLTHQRLHNERKVAGEAAEAAAKGTTRGGNCPGSGQIVIFADQPSVVDGKVVCPQCGLTKRIPKEIKKANPRPTEMPFPNHRKSKEGAEEENAVPIPPHVAPPVFPPIPPVPPPIPPGPMTQMVNNMFGPPTNGVAIPASLEVELSKGVILSSEDVDVVSGLFRDRALAIPRSALSSSTIALLKRLKLVD